MPDCIIPAAGRSQRMKKWKPGLPWAGGTVIETVVDAGRSARKLMGNRRDVERIRDSREGVPLRFLFEGWGMTMIPWDHDGVVADLDTPGEYERVVFEKEYSAE